MQLAFDPTDEWITEELKAAPLDVRSPIVAAVPTFVFVLLPVLLFLISIMILVFWYICDLEFVEVTEPSLIGKVLDIDPAIEDDGEACLSRDVSLCREFSFTSLNSGSVGVDISSVALGLTAISPTKKVGKKGNKKTRRKSFS